MGSKSSSPAIKQQQSSTVINHPLFKQAKLLNNKRGQNIQISIPVVHQNEIISWQKKFKPLIAYECLFLPLSYEFKRTQLCGSNGVCKIKYDNYPFILKEEIHNRGQFSIINVFDNQQLWYLAFNLLQSASIFHQKGQKVGDIQPSSIFINDNGQTKVANQYSWPHQMNNYQKTVYQKQITFLAPQQIKDLHFGLSEPKSNFELAESFSIGLTLLDSTLLTDSSDIYNLSNYRINYQLLDQRKSKLKAANNVDDVLKQIIIGLIAIDPLERLKSVDIFKWMDQYRQKIVNLEPFQIKILPLGVKLQKNNSQYIRSLSNQVPFYVQPKQTSTNRPIVYQQIIRNPHPLPPIAYGINKINISHQPIKPSLPIKQTKVVPQVMLNHDTSIYLQQSPVIAQSTINEVKYAQVPPYSPSINVNSDDFRQTIQKIDQQLAISRQMFPN